jgi:hypothetical protein
MFILQKVGCITCLEGLADHSRTIFNNPNQASEAHMENKNLIKDLNVDFNLLTFLFFERVPTTYKMETTN